jgi:hydrogenase maturation protease
MIICIGARLQPADAAGPRVHDLLARSALPPAVELHDGGLRGLDLASLVLDAGRVVFVDAVAGFAPAPGVVALSAAEVAAEAAPCFGHAAGLPYLLRALPLLAGDRPLPSIAVVGIEGPADEQRVAEAAAAALRLASGGAA